MEPAHPSRLTEGKSPCTSPGASLTKMRELEPSQHSPRRQGSRTMRFKTNAKKTGPSVFVSFFCSTNICRDPGWFLRTCKDGWGLISALSLQDTGEATASRSITEIPDKWDETQGRSRHITPAGNPTWVSEPSA